ncbi:CIA30 family protein [Sulfitobacter sp. S190]|nr:CIA30 family protein [Sulfitobacter sp. S190]
MATAQERVQELVPQWEYVADTVMGGVSRGGIEETRVQGRMATRLTGDVSLDNNGGFIQMAFDLAQGGTFDASDWTGIEIDLTGEGDAYDIRLRTDELRRPWHSYRADLEVPGEWASVRIPFAAFEPHKTDVPLDTARLRRIGVLAIGEEMRADIAVSGIRFYR